jgi:hypothetical protein
MDLVRFGYLLLLKNEPPFMVNSQQDFGTMLKQQRWASGASFGNAKCDKHSNNARTACVSNAKRYSTMPTLSEMRGNILKRMMNI